MEFQVEHQASAGRFVIRHPQGDAVLAYRLGDKQVDFYSTYVPPALRGKGMAEKLVRTGLHWAREHHLVIQASCWYVEKFLR